MRLMFGDLEINTKGLPRIYSVRPARSYTDDRIAVSVMLDSNERAAVEKWAKYLGVEVVDCEPRQAMPGYPWTQAFEAVREVDGYRVRVWTSVELDASAVPVEDAPECPCGCLASCCSCCDAETCVCGPACPVCDRDGGA